MSVSVKISEENYKQLNMISGELQEKLQKPVSLNEALGFLFKKKRKISDLAGSWDMSDKEAELFKKELKKGWKKWKIKSV